MVKKKTPDVKLKSKIDGKGNDQQRFDGHKLFSCMEFNLVLPISFHIKRTLERNPKGYV